MTAEPAPETVSPATPLHRPGWCALHPMQRLVTHQAARISWYSYEDPATVCVLCLADDPAAGDRCTWCGGRLIPEGTPTWSVSPRRAFCTPLHRLHAHRRKEAH